MSNPKLEALMDSIQVKKVYTYDDLLKLAREYRQQSAYERCWPQSVSVDPQHCLDYARWNLIEMDEKLYRELHPSMSISDLAAIETRKIMVIEEAYPQLKTSSQFETK